VLVIVARYRLEKIKVWQRPTLGRAFAPPLPLSGSSTIGAAGLHFRVPHGAWPSLAAPCFTHPWTSDGNGWNPCDMVKVLRHTAYNTRFKAEHLPVGCHGFHRRPHSVHPPCGSRPRATEGGAQGVGSPLICPQCGSEMNLIAVITDRAEVGKILRCLIKTGRALPGLEPSSPLYAPSPPAAVVSTNTPAPQAARQPAAAHASPECAHRVPPRDHESPGVKALPSCQAAPSRSPKAQ
jgi:hypothetical protein